MSPTESSTSSSAALEAIFLHKSSSPNTVPVVSHGFTFNSWKSPTKKEHSIYSSDEECRSISSESKSISMAPMIRISSTTPAVTALANANVTDDNKTKDPIVAEASRGRGRRQGRTRSNSDALDALAMLALSSSSSIASAASASASGTVSSSDDDDLERMPPPPPRRRMGRMRAASNPEGMEKWDAYNHNQTNNFREHFVLPSSILEEELASVNETCRVHYAERNNQQQQQHSSPSLLFATGGNSNVNVPIQKTTNTLFNINPQPHLQQQQQQNESMYGTSPTTVITSIPTPATNTKKSPGKKTSKKTTSKKKSSSSKKENVSISLCSGSGSSGEDENNSAVVDEEEEDSIPEKDLEPEELLRRARLRLFEDLSSEQQHQGVEKGDLPLPHSLDKYKEVYNKRGRIGIYTPAERAAIIAKFNSKRSRRVWNKKIRYNCRKNLADRRMRVKGRFVKRAVEQNALVPVPVVVQPTTTKSSKSSIRPAPTPIANNKSTLKMTPVIVEAVIATDSSSGTSSTSSSRTTSPIPSAPPSGPLAPVQEDEDGDVDMPDVNDPEAGFKPTASQPYRRTRRHTIT